jgi:hypothetical protein
MGKGPFETTIIKNINRLKNFGEYVKDCIIKFGECVKTTA